MSAHLSLTAPFFPCPHPPLHHLSEKANSPSSYSAGSSSGVVWPEDGTVSIKTNPLRHLFISLWINNWITLCNTELIGLCILIFGGFPSITTMCETMFYLITFSIFAISGRKATSDATKRQKSEFWIAQTRFQHHRMRMSPTQSLPLSCLFSWGMMKDGLLSQP